MDFNNIIKNVEYAWNEDGIQISKISAVRGNTYFLDEKRTVKLTFAQGDQREYFRSDKNINLKALEDFIRINESVEHYNAKMKVVFDGGITIENIFFKAIKIRYEHYIPSIKMRPDVVFLNERDEVYFIVEIKRSNGKDEESINKLKTLNINVYEKDIINTEGSRFLCFRNDERETIAAIEERNRIIRRDIETKVLGIKENFKRIGEIGDGRRYDFDGKEEIEQRIKRGREFIQEINYDIEIQNDFRNDHNGRVKEIEAVKISIAVQEKTSEYDPGIEERVKDLRSRFNSRKEETRRIKYRITAEEKDIQLSEKSISGVESRINEIKNRNA